MQVTLEWIANELKAELRGDSACVITGVASLEQATPGKITYCESPRYKKQLAATQASAVLLEENLISVWHGNALIATEPKLAFIRLIQLFHPPQVSSAGVHPSCIIGKNCEIDATASLGPHVVLGNNVKIGQYAVVGAGCFIGDNSELGESTQLYPNVTFYHGSRVGKRCIFHSGVVIGGDGFGFIPTRETWVKIPQIGGVIVGDDCEIGANTTIDRGALEDTVLGNGVKIDNLCIVAHNVRVGDNTIIAACCGIGGSTVIGKNCVFGGGSMVSDHVCIADNVVLAGGSTVTGSLSEVGIYASGTSIQSHREWRKSVVRFRQLDKMHERLRKLEKKEEIHE